MVFPPVPAARLRAAPVLFDKRSIPDAGYDKGDFQAIRLTFFISQHIMNMTPHTTPQRRGNKRCLNGISCALSKDLRFDELRKVLESYGYQMTAPRSGSSHYTFRKAGCMPITIPKHEPIKKVYVEMVRQIVESEAKNDENAE